MALYFGNEDLWQKMLVEKKPDIVFISTNWNSHAPMAIECMKQGAHAFVEVPLATNLKDLWAIVAAAESHQKHCMMLENVNYGSEELLFLNICRQGLLGDLLHAEGAYIHDLRFQMKQDKRGTGSWRRLDYQKQQGNLYPTHGLGPVAQYMSLARTLDNFKSLVSFSSPALVRNRYAKKHFPKNHAWNQLDFKTGDINTSIIKTLKGKTILLQWDENSPRPYTRLNLVQGTKGCLAGFPTRIALEQPIAGLNNNYHHWITGKDLDVIYKKYDHPLYKRFQKQSAGSGHGGMDGIMIGRIVECLQQGLPLDQNLYEGCFWSAVIPLSHQSCIEGGMPQDFPDFTRGHWKKTHPLGIEI